MQCTQNEFVDLIASCHVESPYRVDVLFLTLHCLLSAVMHRPLASSCNPSLREDDLSNYYVFYSAHGLLSIEPTM
jgi:hypothetical protein